LEKFIADVSTKALLKITIILTYSQSNKSTEAM
jgi:hypothetical protein